MDNRVSQEGQVKDVEGQRQDQRVCEGVFWMLRTLMEEKKQWCNTSCGEIKKHSDLLQNTYIHKHSGCSENRLWTQSHEHESFKRMKTLKYLQIWISIYSFTEYRNNGYLIIRDIILDMLLINLLWLVTMIKSVINNNIILFLKEKLIFHWLCIDLST